ncbi:hypothetical protein C1I95_34275, partial [Micromonospora craterilacus]
MSTFEEYAALARNLAAQQRAGEHGAAAEAERQRDLGAAVEYLDRRLTAQGQRLDQFGRTIGAAPGSPPVSGPPVAPGTPAASGFSPTSGPPATSGNGPGTVGT